MTQSEWVEQLLNHLSNSDKPSDFIETERNNGNLEQFFPELYQSYGVEQNKFHKYDVYHHLIYSCDAAVKKLEIRLAALLHDIGKTFTRKEHKGEWIFYNHEIKGTEIAYNILKRWNIDFKIIKKVTLLVRNHMFHYMNHWTDKAIRRLMVKVGEENFEDLFLLRIADRDGNGIRKGEPAILSKLKDRMKQIREEAAQFKIKDLKISGTDLMQLGMKEGPAIGKILKILFQQVINAELENDYDILLEHARSLIENNHNNSGFTNKS